jgi:hypothetical protein
MVKYNSFLASSALTFIWCRLLVTLTCTPYRLRSLVLDLRVCCQRQAGHHGSQSRVSMRRLALRSFGGGRVGCALYLFFLDVWVI